MACRTRHGVRIIIWLHPRPIVVGLYGDKDDIYILLGVMNLPYIITYGFRYKTVQYNTLLYIEPQLQQ